MNIKDIRIAKGLTQQQCADYLSISKRSLQRFELDDTDTSSPKYKFYCEKLSTYDGYEYFLKTDVVYGE